VRPRALGSQIDGQLEFGWLLKSKSAGLGTPQYFIHVGRRQAKVFDDVAAVAHEGAAFKMSFVCEKLADCVAAQQHLSASGGEKRIPVRSGDDTDAYSSSIGW
jgi:hypothetical protein